MKLKTNKILTKWPRKKIKIKIIRTDLKKKQYMKNYNLKTKSKTQNFYKRVKNKNLK